MHMHTAASSPLEALAAFNRQLLEHVVKPFAADGKAPDSTEMMRALASSLAGNSQRWTQIQSRYYEQQLTLWRSFATQRNASEGGGNKLYGVPVASEAGSSAG